MHLLDEEDEIRQIDCLIICGGSDPRAYQSLRKLKENNVDLKKILIFNFAERIASIKDDDIYFDYKGILEEGVTSIDCSIQDPISCFDVFHSHMEHYKSDSQIAIDISCFTKPYFFYLLKYLNERLKVLQPNVFYTEPFSYRFPKKGLFSSYQEAEGPIRIAEIPGFSGIKGRSGITILIVQLGFESESLDEIILDVSPTQSFLVNGFPSYSPKFKDISLVTNEVFTRDRDSIILYSRSNNPFEIFNLLERIKKNYSKAFINIAPLGTKPMALGTCLFAIHNPDVKVIFPVSENYRSVTTNECWNSWIYRVPLKFS